MRELNIEKEIEKIKLFIKTTIIQAGFKKTVVGLSGGIDSALTAVLCKESLGAENLIGIMMPYKNSHPDSLSDAKLLAETFGIKYHIIPVTIMVDAYFNSYEPDADFLRKGNRMARERMCILYDYSSKYKALVAGTSNKSEIYVGYCTQYGDSACAFEPLAHLYKTEVKAISEYLNIPKKIIDKNPTADLWDGQTDEAELGITYKELDLILYYILDLKLSKEEIINKGIDLEKYKLVMNKINTSVFKRTMPKTIENVWE